MSKQLEHIDAIARRKQRDVLCVEFHGEFDPDMDWENLPVRTEIIDWMNRNGIVWGTCDEFASTHFTCSFLGYLYIDVPHDESSPDYQKLRNYLEYPDGSCRFKDVRFCVCLLEMAMKNAHHDEPGFWEKWAENLQSEVGHT